MKQLKSAPSRFGLVLSALLLAAAGTQYGPIGCAGLDVQQTPITDEQLLGKWIISNYRERDTATYEHDGEVVRIRKKDNIYTIQSPDWFFNEAKFRLIGPALFGVSVQDYDALKENFGTTPDSVVQQAASSREAIYRGSLTMLRNGRLLAVRDNLQIHYDSEGRYRGFTRSPGWIKFILTRQDQIGMQEDGSSQTALESPVPMVACYMTEFSPELKARFNSDWIGPFSSEDECKQANTMVTGSRAVCKCN